MKILVDTSVWSLALRRKQIDFSPHLQELVKLINDMLGADDQPNTPRDTFWNQNRSALCFSEGTFAVIS